MKHLLSITAVSILLLSSCNKERIKGEGAIVSETRALPSFTSVNLNGSEELEIIASNENKIVVRGYQNLVPIFHSSTSGNRLNLEFDSKYYNIRNNNIQLTLYTKELDKVYLNGSGNISIRDSLKTNNLELSINGSGNMYLYDNYLEHCNLYVNGSGNINAQRASGKYVYANISGSGNIEVSVREKLDAHISGSGEIHYWGNPSIVNSDISGSGKIKKH